MSPLDEKLQQFHQAQEALYEYIGISRRDGAARPGLRYSHGSGNADIPTAYPEVLDYRAQRWTITENEQTADEELHVMLADVADWSPENTVRFSILSIWDEPTRDGAVYVVGHHLPKPDELHYAHPDEVARVEGGENFLGDTCVLLLNPDRGYTELEDYQIYLGEQS